MRPKFSLRNGVGTIAIGAALFLAVAFAPLVVHMPNDPLSQAISLATGHVSVVIVAWGLLKLIIAFLLQLLRPEPVQAVPFVKESEPEQPGVWPPAPKPPAPRPP